jgi:acylphosphatase|tara:strand:- start:221 stop:496 length:276 start_codon:yes stop_codon:yes gene_type:complete
MKKRLLISGKVQGVGFRHWLCMKAVEKNICGWVRNIATGEVEALVIGNDEDVDKLIKQCKQGPFSSKVTQVKIQNYQQDYPKKSFVILRAN